MFVHALDKTDLYNNTYNASTYCDDNDDTLSVVSSYDSADSLFDDIDIDACEKPQFESPSALVGYMQELGLSLLCTYIECNDSLCEVRNNLIRTYLLIKYNP
jgi:hypothetical protein